MGSEQAALLMQSGSGVSANIHATLELVKIRYREQVILSQGSAGVTTHATMSQRSKLLKRRQWLFNQDSTTKKYRGNVEHV